MRIRPRIARDPAHPDLGPDLATEPYTPPKENQIAVRNRAVAVNPLDWGTQLAGSFLYRWLKYPAVGTYLAARNPASSGTACRPFSRCSTRR